MIKLFKANELDFSHNENVITAVESAVASEKGNDLFELDMSCALRYQEKIVAGSIITAPTPRGEQPFRVYRTQTTLTKLQVKARHIFYDVANNFLLDCRPTQINGQGAVSRIMEARDHPSPIVLSSDVAQIATAYYVRTTELEALMGADNSVLARWGGYLIRDGLKAHLKDAPLDRGYLVELGKNLLGIDAVEDTTGVVTRLIPSFVLSDNKAHLLPEVYIDSPLASHYPEPIVREMRIDLTEVQRATEKPEDLYPFIRDQVAKAFAEGIDKPQISYRVNFILLSKTEAYKRLNLLEQLDIWDMVACRVPSLGIDVQLAVVAYQYDALKEQFISMDLGDTRPTTRSISEVLQRTIEKQIDSEASLVTGRVLKAQKDNTDLITGARGGNVVTSFTDDGKPYQMSWMDTDDIATAKYVVRINPEGIGISQSGFNGPFDIAFTAEHGLYAKYIYGLKVTAAELEAGAVTAEKIAVNAVNGDHISPGSISTDDLVDNAITTTKIYPGAITTGKIAANAIVGGHIQAGAISASKLSANELFSLNGTFTGTIRANDGYFKGQLQATTGTFGTLSVSSGRTTGSYYGGLSGCTGSVSNLFGSLKDIGGTLKGVGGTIANMGGSVTSLGGSLNKTLGIHAGATTGSHTGNVNSNSISGSLNKVSGSATLTSSSLSGSFNGTAQTNTSSAIGGRLNSTNGTHSGDINCATGYLGTTRFYSNNGYLKFAAGLDLSGGLLANGMIRSTQDIVANAGKMNAKFGIFTYLQYTTSTQTSDERLKEHLESVPDDLIDAFYKLPLIKYNFKQEPHKSKVGINASALFWRSESPLKEYLIGVNKDGYLTADYSCLANIGLAALQQLNERVKKLEETHDYKF